MSIFRIKNYFSIFDLNENKIKEYEILNSDRNLSHYVSKEYPILKNGKEIDINTYQVQDDDFFERFIVPQKGNWKDIGGAILTGFIVAAVTLATGGAGLTLAGLGTAAGYGMVAGSIVGTIAAIDNYLSNKDPKQPKAGWDGIAMTSMTQGDPVPVLYGSYAVGGNIVAKSLKQKNDKMYLNILLSLTGHYCNSWESTTLQVNNQIIAPAKYNATFYDGRNEQEVSDGFDNIQTFQTINQSFEQSVPKEINTAGDTVQDVRINLSFRLGLYNYTPNEQGGSYGDETATFLIKAKVTGEVSYTMSKSINITSRTPGNYVYTTTLYELFETTYPGIFGAGATPQAWTVYIERTSAIYDLPKTQSSSWVDEIEEIYYKEVDYPNRALLALYDLNADDFSGSIPSVSVVVNRTIFRRTNPSVPAEILDPFIISYLDGKAANNPAYAIIDILTNLGYSDAKLAIENIDTTAFEAYATFCNDNNLTCNILFNSETTAIDASMQIAGENSGVLIFKGSKVSIAIDTYDVTPTQLFSDGNIKANSLTRTFISQNELKNALNITFINADHNYIKESFDIQGDAWTQETENKKNITFSTITDFNTALAQATKMLKYNQYCTESVEFDVELDALNSTVMDLIYVAHSRIDFGTGFAQGRITDAEKRNYFTTAQAEFSSGWENWGNELTEAYFPSGGYENSSYIKLTKTGETYNEYYINLTITNNIFSVKVKAGDSGSIGKTGYIYFNGSPYIYYFTLTNNWQTIYLYGDSGSQVIIATKSGDNPMQIGDSIECCQAQLQIGSTLKSFVMPNDILVSLDKDLAVVSTSQYKFIYKNLDNTLLEYTYTASTTGDITNLYLTIDSADPVPNKYDVYAVYPFTEQIDKYRITNISRTSNLERRISAIKFDERVYTDDVVTTVIPEYTVDASAKRLKVNLFSDRNKYNGNIYTRLNWGVDIGQQVDSWKVYYRLKDSSDDWTLYKDNIYNNYLDVYIDYQHGSEYEFAVAGSSLVVEEIPDSATSTSIVINPQTLPDDVTNFAAVFNSKFLNLSWDKQTDSFIEGYEIRRYATDAGWETATFFAFVKDDYLTVDMFAEYGANGKDPYHYYIKAKSTQQTFSTNAASLLKGKDTPTCITSFTNNLFLEIMEFAFTIATRDFFGIEIRQNTSSSDFDNSSLLIKTNEIANVKLNFKNLYDTAGNATRYFYLKTYDEFGQYSSTEVTSTHTKPTFNAPVLTYNSVTKDGLICNISFIAETVGTVKYNYYFNSSRNKNFFVNSNNLLLIPNTFFDSSQIDSINSGSSLPIITRVDSYFSTTYEATTTNSILYVKAPVDGITFTAKPMYNAVHFYINNSQLAANHNYYIVYKYIEDAVGAGTYTYVGYSEITYDNSFIFQYNREAVSYDTNLRCKIYVRPVDNLGVLGIAVSAGSDAYKPITLKITDYNLDYPIMSGFSWTEGATVAWADGVINFKGNTYAITDDSTDKKYIYWETTSPTILKYSDTKPIIDVGVTWLIGIFDSGVLSLTKGEQMMHAGILQASTVTADLVGANQIITVSANIGDAVINDAHIFKLSSDVIVVGDSEVNLAYAVNDVIEDPRLRNLIAFHNLSINDQIGSYKPIDITNREETEYIENLEGHCYGTDIEFFKDYLNNCIVTSVPSKNLLILNQIKFTAGWTKGVSGDGDGTLSTGEDDFYYAVLTRTAGTGDVYYYSDIIGSTGQVFSVEVKANNASGIGASLMLMGNSSDQEVGKVTNQWQRFQLKNNVNNRAYIIFDNTLPIGGQIKIRKPKFETGNYATPFTVPNNNLLTYTESCGIAQTMQENTIDATYTSGGFKNMPYVTVQKSADTTSGYYFFDDIPVASSSVYSAGLYIKANSVSEVGKIVGISLSGVATVVLVTLTLEWQPVKIENITATAITSTLFIATSSNYDANIDIATNDKFDVCMVRQELGTTLTNIFEFGSSGYTYDNPKMGQINYDKALALQNEFSLVFKFKPIHDYQIGSYSVYLDTRPAGVNLGFATWYNYTDDKLAFAMWDALVGTTVFYTDAITSDAQLQQDYTYTITLDSSGVMRWYINGVKIGTSVFTYSAARMFNDIIKVGGSSFNPADEISGCEVKEFYIKDYAMNDEEVKNIYQKNNYVVNISSYGASHVLVNKDGFQTLSQNGSIINDGRNVQIILKDADGIDIIRLGKDAVAEGENGGYFRNSSLDLEDTNNKLRLLLDPTNYINFYKYTTDRDTATETYLKVATSISGDAFAVASNVGDIRSFGIFNNSPDKFAVTIKNNHANNLGLTVLSKTLFGAEVAFGDNAITGVSTINTSSTVTAGGLLTAGAGLTVSTGNLGVTLGDITAGAGDISATNGSVSAGTTLSAGTTITAGTGITATTGDIVASADDIIATLGNIEATVGSITAGLNITAAAGNINGKTFTSTTTQFNVSVSSGNTLGVCYKDSTNTINEIGFYNGNNTGDYCDIRAKGSFGSFSEKAVYYKVTTSASLPTPGIDYLGEIRLYQQDANNEYLVTCRKVGGAYSWDAI